MSVSFETIVVAVDFSETSEDAWKAACRLASISGGHLHLVHVSPDPLRQAWTVEAIGVDFAAVSKEWQAQSEVRLHAMQPDPPIPADRLTRAVLVGVPHAAIVAYAADQKADVIVVGTHGYGPVKHLLLGSVAERVVRQAPCPVLTVPHRLISSGTSQTPAAAASA